MEGSLANAGSCVSAAMLRGIPERPAKQRGSQRVVACNGCVLPAAAPGSRAETTTARRASPLFYSVLDEERYTHAEAVFFARASAVWAVVLTTDRCERSPSAVRQAFAIGSIFSADRRLQAQACRARHDVVGVARWMQGFAARRRTGSKGSAWRG